MGAALAIPETQDALRDALVELVERVARRDQAALARLYDLTVDRAFAVALRVLGDRNDAEEAVADTYQQVWERGGYAPGRGSVLSWLLVIAYSRAVDLKRRVADRYRCDPMHPEDGEETYTDCEERPVPDLLDLVREGTAVHAALRDLAEQPRRLITMAFLEDLTHQQIAERTGIALGTVKSHIRRGLLQLRERLAAQGLSP
jgi:RNA polymerase sigma-70 factor (ECF subfamily)